MTDAEIRAYLADPGHAAPCSRLLGFEMLDFSSTEGWAEMAFNPRAEFANPIGSVQGGFVAAMLDDAMGVAGSIAVHYEKVVPTLQLNVVFIHPTPVERLIARGEVVRLGRNTSLLTGSLKRMDGTLLATATASTAVRTFPRENRLRTER